MAELRERDGKKNFPKEATTNGGAEQLEKKPPLDGDMVSVEGTKGVKLKRQVRGLGWHSHNIPCLISRWTWVRISLGQTCGLGI